MGKIRQRIFLIVAALSLLLNSFAPVIVSSVYAQEASSSAELSYEPSPTPQVETLEASSSAQAESTPSSTPSPTVLSQPLWTENAGSYTTETLKLNTTYKFPPNEKVSLTFSKLPDSSGTVTVKEVSALGTTAYDITSTMTDGTFEYTLTLPTSTTENVEVKASEDGQTFVTLGGVSPGDSILTITGLNHFTVFVVVGTISGTPATATSFDESSANILINEFVYDTTATNDAGEWVEVFNKSNSSIDLTGWKLEDGNNIADDINLSGTIPAGGFAVFENNSWLNNTGTETINLKNGSTLVDQVSYKDGTVVGADDVGNIAAGQSVSRVADGGSDWIADSTTSKGWSNSLSSPTAVYVDSTYSDLETGAQSQPFNTIQEGVDAVAAGGTVNVVAGEYDESDIQVAKDGVSIIGPGTASGVNRAFVSTSGCAGFPSSIFHLHADGVTLTGLDIDGSGSCEHAVHVGGVTEIQVADVLVSGNVIHGADYGVTISWGSSNNTELPNIISNNDIYENNLAGVLLNSASNNNILQNQIHDNVGPGIELIDCLENGAGNCGSPAPSNNTITGNVIENNSSVASATGIHIFNGGENNTANSNIILGNGVGVQNDDPNNFFDATLNFWGDPTGPFHPDLNPDGQGDSISDNVLFSPFYLGESQTTFEIMELDINNIASFVSDGIFDLPDGEEGQALVDFVRILQQVEFDLAMGGGESDVFLPEGVIIDRSDGQEFEWADLDLEDIAESFLSGFSSGEVVEEALQWGLPGIELEFEDAAGNPSPITLSIFVGEDLNGQTLNVVRSTSGSGGWTSVGIVSPGTCVVANGLCTFQATKASYFAATKTVTTSPTSTSTTQALSPAGGGGTPPVCNDQKPGSAPRLLNTVSGANSVTLNWSKAQNPVTYYLVNYSLTAGKFQFGNPNVGGADTTSYQVQGLSGGNIYYFKVRAGNGCAPGDYSNELAAVPTGGFISGPAAGFAPGVLGAKTKIEEQKVMVTPTSTPQPQIIDIQLEQPQVSGDNLFSRILGFISSLFKGLFGR